MRRPAQAKQHDPSGLGRVPLGRAPDAAAAGDGQGRAARVPGAAPQLSCHRGLPAHSAREGAGRLPAGTQDAPEAGAGGFGGDARQRRDHRPALPRHRHRQDGDRRAGRQAPGQAHAISGAHGGAGGSGRRHLPRPLARGDGGPLC